MDVQDAHAHCETDAGFFSVCAVVSPRSVSMGPERGKSRLLRTMLR